MSSHPNAIGSNLYTDIYSSLSFSVNDKSGSPKHGQETPSSAHLLHFLRLLVQWAQLGRHGWHGRALQGRTRHRVSQAETSIFSEWKFFRFMLGPACARSQGGIFQVIIHRAILTRGLAQVLNFTQYSSAIGGEKFFSDAHKANNAAVGRDSEGVGHEILNQGGVAFVGRWLDLGREGSDGENVGGFERAGIEEAGGVGEGDED